MDFEIVEKGQTFDIQEKASGRTKYYFGAGWDNPHGPVDLDIVCALLIGGGLKDQASLVYFGNRNAPGVALSEDNTTGEGEGDDESIVICTDELPPNVDSVVVGLACYSNTDFSKAPNPHFRVCDGTDEASTQLADCAIKGAAAPGSTVLEAFRLNKTDSGWTLTNLGNFHACANGSQAIEGFTKLYR